MAYTLSLRCHFHKMEEESHRVYYRDNECLSGSTKCWIFKSIEVHSIESLKGVQEFCQFVIVTPFSYCRDLDFTFSRP